MNQDRVVQEDERPGSICGGVGGVVFFFWWLWRMGYGVGCGSVFLADAG